MKTLFAGKKGQLKLNISLTSISQNCHIQWLVWQVSYMVVYLTHVTPCHIQWQLTNITPCHIQQLILQIVRYGGSSDKVSYHVTYSDPSGWKKDTRGAISNTYLSPALVFRCLTIDIMLRLINFVLRGLQSPNNVTNFLMTLALKGSNSSICKSISIFCINSTYVTMYSLGAQACSWHLRKSNHYCRKYAGDFRWERHPPQEYLVERSIFYWIIYVLNLLPQSRRVELPVMFHCIYIISLTHITWGARC